MAEHRFDALAKQTLLPARDAAKDPVRQEIDAAVSEMFAIHKAQPAWEEGVPFQEMLASDSFSESGIRDATEILQEVWCAEPSVHGRKDPQEDLP